MADNVASLGLAVESSSVQKGTKDLDNLSAAAKRAQSSATALSGAARNAGAASNSAAAGARANASALQAEASAAARAAGALRTHAVAVNDNARRMGGSMSGLAAQFQDIGVTAAMGMNPAIIALQQGTQIAGQMEAAMQGGASATSVLGTAFKSLFSPLTFVVIALTAIAAAGFQLVDWAGLGASALYGLANALEPIAPYAVAAAAGLALVYAPAILSGLAAVAMGLWGVARAAGAVALAFAVANPAAAFVLGLTAIITAASIFRDEITRIFGVDIVGIVKDAANYVINSFRAAFADIQFVWNNFGDIMGAAVIGGVNIAIRAINGLIEKATAGIDRLLEYINPVLEAAGMEGMGKVGSNFSLKELDNPYSGRLGAANDAHAADIAKIMSEDTIGQFGGAIAAGASKAAEKLRELAGAMTAVDEKAKKKSRGGKTEAEKYSDIVDGANRRIASLRAEQEALGLTEFEAAKLAYTTDLLNEAQRKGITLSAAQRAELSNLAGTMASIEIATMKAKEAMDFAKDVTRGFIDDFRSGIEQGKSVWESFANAALNALDKIADKLLNDVLNAIFQVNSAGTGMGGGGGILGSLFGSLFGGGGFSAAAYAGIGQGLYAKGGVFDQSGVTAFAKGGVVNTPTVFPFAKGIGLMGEAGPEAIMPLRRGPDGRLGVAANDRAANQNGPQQININVNVDGANGDQHVIALVQEGVARGIGEYNKALPDRMNQINQNPRRRSA